MYSQITDFIKKLPELFKTGFDVLKKILYENLKVILVGVISILMIIAAAIVISLYFGGDTARELVISEIQGSVFITRDSRRFAANKNSKLKSGDIITTDSNGTARIAFDGDKYIFVEQDSMVYIYFTGISSKGDISVNLSRGAAICQINNELKKNASFTLKTPNSVVSVRGTVFRTQFDYLENYMGYSNVMITHVQDFDGTVTLQLYDHLKEPFDLPMLLLERTAAQMITSEDICQYGYLNYDIDLYSLSETTLHEVLRAGNEKNIAYSPEELNIAYKSVFDEMQRNDSDTTDSTEVTVEDTTVTSTTVTTTETKSETTTTQTETTSVTESDTDTRTLPTTQKRQEYTTYSGIKWWEITGNTNTGTDDYEDWFTEEPDGLENEAVSTTVPNVQ